MPTASKAYHCPKSGQFVKDPNTCVPTPTINQHLLKQETKLCRCQPYNDVVSKALKALADNKEIYHVSSKDEDASICGRKYGKADKLCSDYVALIKKEVDKKPGSLFRRSCVCQEESGSLFCARFFV